MITQINQKVTNSSNWNTLPTKEGLENLNTNMQWFMNLQKCNYQTDRILGHTDITKCMHEYQ